MKLYKNIIISVLVIAVLAGVLIYINNIPKKEEEAPQTPPTQTEYIDVFRLNKEDIKSINVKTKNSSYSVTKNDDTFTLSNSKNIDVDKQKLDSFVSSCSYLYVEKIFKESVEDISEFGFDDPESTVEINLLDGTKKIIYIGGQTIDGSSNYIKLEGEDKIYLKGAYGVLNLAPEYNSFVSLKVLKVNPTDYQKLKQVNIKKSGNTAIEISAVTETNEGAVSTSWKMVAPVHADANTVILAGNVLEPLASFSAYAVVEANFSNLNKYGLDNPYAVISLKTDDGTQKFTFGNEANGYRFFMVDSYKSVYIAPVSSVSFLEIAYIDLMSRLVHTENITNVSKVEIKGISSNFLLEIDGENRHINGVKFEIDEFSKIYQEIISINLDSVDINAKKTASPDVSIKYTRTNGMTCTVEFIPINDRNYLALVDGKGSSIVKKNTVTEALDFIQKELDAKK